MWLIFVCSFRNIHYKIVYVLKLILFLFEYFMIFLGTECYENGITKRYCDFKKIC